MFAVLGGAIGLAAWDTDSGKALGIGAAVWTLVSILAALYLGGTTTGRLAGVLTRKDGILHGIVLWSVSMLFTVWLIANGVGALAGTTFRIFGNVAGAAAGAVAQGAATAVGSAAGGADVNAGDIRGEIEALLRQTGDPALRPESLEAKAGEAGQAATQTGASNAEVAGEIADLIRGTAGQVDREAVINVIGARTGQSRAEAERIADRAIALRQTVGAKIDTLQAQVGEQAEDVAGATSTGLWFALLGMGLSVAAAVAGAAGTAGTAGE